MRTSGTAAQKERQRHEALALVRQGFSSAAVARQLRVDPRTVRRWKATFRRDGAAGLKIKAASGRPSRLTASQRRRLIGRLLRGALSQGFSSDLWTCPRIAELIAREYGVTYHVDHIPRLMRGLGFSVQKPERRARERDEEAIRDWVRHDWERIKKKPPAGGRRSSSSMKRGSS